MRSVGGAAKPNDTGSLRGVADSAPTATDPAGWVEEEGVDRPGKDLRKMWLSGGAAACRTACERDPACRAYTYLKPRRAGSSGLCLLKSAAPKPVKNLNAVSGVRPEGTGTPGRTAVPPGPGLSLRPVQGAGSLPSTSTKPMHRMETALPAQGFAGAGGRSTGGEAGGAGEAGAVGGSMYPAEAGGTATPAGEEYPQGEESYPPGGGSSEYGSPPSSPQESWGGGASGYPDSGPPAQTGPTGSWRFMQGEAGEAGSNGSIGFSDAPMGGGGPVGGSAFGGGGFGAGATGVPGGGAGSGYAGGVLSSIASDKPELLISGMEIRHPNPRELLADPQTRPEDWVLEISIANAGKSPAANVALLIAVGEKRQEAVLPRPLDPNSRTTATFTIPAEDDSLAGGRVEIRALLDPRGEIDERNRENNLSSITFSPRGTQPGTDRR
ncbi:MAG: hypothetical protein Kow00128_18150 [Deltaproteobacteria bacterium]